jgi:signal peptidase I
VAVRGQEVYVNGKKLDRERVPTASVASLGERITGEVASETNAASRYLIMLNPASTHSPDFIEKKVPEGACFVLGDNRNLSSDSRDLGFVPLGDIFGFVQYIYYPAASWSRFGACQE